ncbi:MAG: hypothetical protein ACLRSA_03485 [Streptococcus salivarius]
MSLIIDKTGLLRDSWSKVSIIIEVGNTSIIGLEATFRCAVITLIVVTTSSYLAKYHVFPFSSVTVAGAKAAKSRIQVKAGALIAAQLHL